MRTEQPSLLFAFRGEPRRALHVVASQSNTPLVDQSNMASHIRQRGMCIYLEVGWPSATPQLRHPLHFASKINEMERDTCTYQNLEPVDDTPIMLSYLFPLEDEPGGGGDLYFVF